MWTPNYNNPSYRDPTERTANCWIKPRFRFKLYWGSTVRSFAQGFLKRMQKDPYNLQGLPGAPGYSPSLDRTWGISGSYSNIPKAIFYLPKGDYMLGGPDPLTFLGILASLSLEPENIKIPSPQVRP